MATCPLCSGSRSAFDCRALLYSETVRDIYHCADCDSSFFWPIPAPEEIAKCYPHAYFQDFYKQYWKDRYKGRALARRVKRWKDKGRFLDVGCALGTLAAGFREASGWQASGLEYMPAAVSAGKALNGIEIAPGGIQGALWPEGSFDYIHANNVLEHESDPLSALRSAARLLKRAGRLHLTLPNGRFDILANRKLYCQLGRPVRTRHSGHLFSYSAKALRLLLDKAGFRVLWIKGFHFKTALKARDWLPGAYRHFLNKEAVRSDTTPSEKMPADYQAGIPAAPSEWAYRVQSGLRRLLRRQNSENGYDFEILAERT